MPEKKKVLAAISDLMFTVKIQEAAKRAGLDATFVKTADLVLDRAAGQPAVILIDLNCSTIDGVALITQLKSDPATAQIPLISFLSHVQGDLKQAAHEAGCDMVLPRSAFSQNIMQILARFGTVTA
jgi:CheY-like chemotaxis protein